MEPKKKKNKKKKILEDEDSDYFEVDEDSDFVIHEKYLKPGKVKK